MCVCVCVCVYMHIHLCVLVTEFTYIYIYIFCIHIYCIFMSVFIHSSNFMSTCSILEFTLHARDNQIKVYDPFLQMSHF